jgi:ABC-type Fe3+/spermidine/putrescine transport system ATPase subunit
MRLADRVVVMDRGQIQFVGDPAKAIEMMSEDRQ